MHFFRKDSTHDQKLNFILNLKCVEKIRLAFYLSPSVCCIEKHCDTNQDKKLSSYAPILRFVKYVEQKH